MSNLISEIHLPIASLTMLIPVVLDIVSTGNAFYDRKFTSFKTDLHKALSADENERDDKIRKACGNFLSDDLLPTPQEKRKLTGGVSRENLHGIKQSMVDILRIAVDNTNLTDSDNQKTLAAWIVIVNEAFRP